MKHLTLIKGGLQNGVIDTEISIADIFENVMNKKIAIIKGVFPAADARRLRDLAFQWGLGQSISQSGDFYNQGKKNNFYKQQGISKIQKTLHYYRTHNFNNYDELNNDELEELLTNFFTPLKNFYNVLTGNTADFIGEHKIIHPEIIHYPSGGGFFAKHFHSLEPQRIGMIVSLSKYGEDYNSGGTGFEVDGDIVDSEKYHDIGDIVLFRYDLGHWVSPCDIEEAMDASSPRGRWTLILPYY